MRKTILCVDNEVTSLEMLKQQLKDRFGTNADVEGFLDGMSALNFIDQLRRQRKEAAVVISEQILSDMKGIELLNQCHQKSANCQLFLLTAQVDDSVVIPNKGSLYKLFRKPCNTQELLDSVEKALADFYLLLELKQLREENTLLKAQLKDNHISSNTPEQAESIDKQQLMDQLVRSEKLASLGNMMAGIAHEINTPLGAIKASIGAVKENLWTCFHDVLNISKMLSKDELDLFVKMIKQGANEKQFLSSREERSKRKEITQLMTS